MDQAWRDHLEDEGDGTMRIRAHGHMKVDARLITDAAHMVAGDRNDILPKAL